MAHIKSGNTILDNYCRYTKQPFNTTFYAALPAGAVVDNVVWFKNRDVMKDDDGIEIPVGGFSKREGLDFYNVKIFGAIGDGNSHPLSERYPTLIDAKKDYPFATSLSQEIDWASIQKAIFAACRGSIQVSDDRFYNSNTVLIPKSIGAYVTKDPIYHKFGSTLRFESSVIKAIANVDYIIWTKDEGVPEDPTVYGNCNLSIEGSGILDGNGFASYGYWGNTVNASQIGGMRAERVNRKKWNDNTMTVSATAYATESRNIVVNDVTQVRLRDHVRVYSGSLGRYLRGSYTVSAINTTTKTISLVNGLCESILNDGSAYYINHIPTGFLLNGNQYTVRNLKASNCTCPAAFGVSRTGNGNTPANYDDNLYDELFFEENDHGVCFVNISGSLIGKVTSQHNKYENYIVSNGDGLIFQRLYNEAGTNFTSLNKELYPLAYFHGRAIDVGMDFPSNISNGWARMVESDTRGLHITVYSGSVIENPLVAGDLALVKHANRTSIVCFTDLRIAYCLNFQSKDTIKKSVINQNYSYPSGRCRIYTYDSANGDPLEAGIRRMYDNVEMFTGQNPFAGLSLRNGGVYFGNGTALQDGSIIRIGNADIGTGGGVNWTVDYALKLKKSDGAFVFLFADTQQRLRISNSAPATAADKDTHGTVIGNLDSPIFTGMPTAPTAATTTATNQIATTLFVDNTKKNTLQRNGTIAQDTRLNNYTVAGDYLRGGGANTKLNDYPWDNTGAGNLSVSNNDPLFISHRYHELSSNRIAIRSYVNNAWTPWREITTTAIA